MKRLIYFSVLLLSPVFTKAQNTGVGTTTPQEKLEVKNPLRSTIKISSSSFSDTTQLILSNRTAGNVGTDFKITSPREQGLRISSSSDIPANNVDPILTIISSGKVGVCNTAPAEELDVTGNINVTGTIKANGVDGSAGQVLMKGNTGNLAWGNFSPYRHVRLSLGQFHTL